VQNKALIYRLFVVAGCLIIGFFSNSHAEYTVRFEPTITGSDVSGHDDKFRELFQIPEDASGGLGLFAFDGLIPTGQELHLDISAQYDDEYKAGIQLRGKELWTLDLKFQGFKTYSNNASEFYTFAPAAFTLDRDLDVTRGDLSFKFSLNSTQRSISGLNLPGSKFTLVRVENVALQVKTLMSRSATPTFLPSTATRDNPFKA